MKDKLRLTFLEQSIRLANWLQRSKLPPREFMKRHRLEIDKLAAPIVDEYKPRPRKWRDWDELSEREKNKIIKQDRNRMSIKAAQLKLKPEAQEEINNITQEIRSKRRHSYTVARNRFRVRPWHDREGTPIERLAKQRVKKFRSAFNTKNHQSSVHPTFVADLHPNDVEIEVTGSGILTLAARNAAKLSAMLGDSVLAALLYTQDDVSEVYYAAVLIASNNNPRVEQCFIGRGRQIQLDGKNPLLDHDYWLPTKRFNTAKGALQAARRLYGKSVGRKIDGDA